MYQNKSWFAKVFGQSCASVCISLFICMLVGAILSVLCNIH
jgi:hypothetical protein